MISCSPGNFHQYDQLSEENPSDQMHYKCNCPCDHALSDHNPDCPFATEFSFDRCNCSNTWCRRQNASRLAAAKGVIQPSKVAVLPNKTESVDTTLSFAINPVINAVEIRQSPNPIGLKIGAITLATIARILSFESVTMLKCTSKVCRNQITRVAINITVNALCRKSFVLRFANA